MKTVSRDITTEPQGARTTAAPPSAHPRRPARSTEKAPAAQGWVARLRARPLALFYLATPAFALLDLAGGLNLRLSFLAGHPALRIGYYLTCLGLGWLILRADRRASALVGLGETTLNLTVLCLSVVVPLAELPARVAAGAPAYNPFTPLFFANLVISAAVFLYAFYTNPLLRGGLRYH
jgi:hypothetical protein